MKTVNVDIFPDGHVEITGEENFNMVIATDHFTVNNNEHQKVVVTDHRTLTDTAQYNIGWHDGYRANHNDAAVAAAYLEIDKRMVASLKPKDSIGE